MDQGRPGAGEVLNAEKHLVLLAGRRHQQSLALPLAGLERRARVTHLAREHQGLVVGERLVDDDRAQARRPVHHVLPVGLQVAGRRLLDVEDAVEPRGGLFFEPLEVLEQPLHVGAVLVEVETVEPLLDPARLFGLGCDAVDRHGPVQVPPEIAAVELDLDAGHSVVADPRRQGLGQTVVEPLDDVALDDRVACAHGVKERHPRRRFAPDVARERLPFELRSEVVPEVVAHQVGAAGQVGARAVRLAERVVERRVERARGHKRAELRDRRRQPKLRRHRRGRLQVLGLERRVDVDRMPRLAVGRRDPGDAPGERLHGAERRLVRHHLGRKRPDVAERHRAEAARDLPGDGPDRAADVQERDAVDRTAAEHVGRPVEELLVARRDLFDPDVGRLRAGGEARRETGASRGPKESAPAEPACPNELHRHRGRSAAARGP